VVQRTGTLRFVGKTYQTMKLRYLLNVLILALTGLDDGLANVF
jgi:hypothetical protein